MTQAMVNAGMVSTHEALIAAEHGLVLTCGNHPSAQNVVMCPSQGVVSLWASGTVPASALYNGALPWVLVKGPGCKALRRGKGNSEGGVLSHSSFGLDAPLDTWIPLGHALLDDWISALSCTFGMPLGMCGLLTLAAISSALCPKQRVHMQIATPMGPQISWKEEHCGIYVVGLAASGMKKTPTYEAIMQPWFLRQRVLATGHEGRVAAWNARVGRARQQIERGQGDESTTIQRLAELHQVANEPAPRQPMLFVNNATGPWFGQQLAFEPHVFVATSEATEVFAAMQSSEGRMELEQFLEAYSGSVGGGVGRISREQPSTGSPRRAAMLSLTQPEGLYGLGLKHQVALEQGLFARFLWFAATKALPKSGAIPASLMTRWVAFIHGLMDRPGPARNAWGVESGDPFTVTASPSQTAALLAQSERLTARTDPGGDLYGLASWAGKIHGGEARLAALLTVLDGLEGQLAQGYLDWAMQIGETMLLPHAKYAWALTRWPANTKDASHLFYIALVHAKDVNPRSSFAQMEIDRWVSDWSPKQVDDAVTTLCERGYATVQGRARTDRTVTFV